MKIFIDMNLTPLWRDALRLDGHEAKHWSEIGPASAPDAVLMEWARLHGYIILTLDLDFGALLHATQALSPGVIQIRGDDVHPEHLGQVVRNAIATLKQELQAGALATVDVKRRRVTLLPLRR